MYLFQKNCLWQCQELPKLNSVTIKMEVELFYARSEQTHYATRYKNPNDIRLSVSAIWNSWIKTQDVCTVWRMLPDGNILHTAHTSCHPTLQHHNSYNRTDNYRQWNAVGSPDDGHKDVRNMLRYYWLPINHYLLHLVGFSFTYVQPNFRLPLSCVLIRLTLLS